MRQTEASDPTRPKLIPAPARLPKRINRFLNASTQTAPNHLQNPTPDIRRPGLPLPSKTTSHQNQTKPLNQTKDNANSKFRKTKRRNRLVIPPKKSYLIIPGIQTPTEKLYVAGERHRPLLVPRVATTSDQTQRRYQLEPRCRPVLPARFYSKIHLGRECT